MEWHISRRRGGHKLLGKVRHNEFTLQEVVADKTCNNYFVK